MDDIAERLIISCLYENAACMTTCNDTASSHIDVTTVCTTDLAMVVVHFFYHDKLFIGSTLLKRIKIVTTAVRSAFMAKQQDWLSSH